MTVVAVTGASGKTGRTVAEHLAESGIEVRAIDSAGPPGDRGTGPLPLLRADLTDYGQTVDALHGADAVVHLAAIPAPGFFPDAHTLSTNNAINSNVFLAAVKLGLQRVVWTSSETTLGFPFGDDTPPRYLPVDEAHYPMPRSTYALSKVVAATMADHLADWSGIPFVALCLSNVHEVSDYPKVPSFQADVRSRVFNLWGYIDVRDVALACRLALTAPVTGSRGYLIAADDTLMDTPSAELARQVFPDVPVTGALDGYASLLSNRRAREELGFRPAHSWRDEVPTTQA